MTGPLADFCRALQSLHCSRCARTFESNATYTDLTVTSGTQQRVYKQQSTAGQEIFRHYIAPPLLATCNAFARVCKG